MVDTLPPAVDETKLNDLGVTLFAQWGTYVTDRKMVEERWLRNLRQVRKIYDPEVEKLIPADRSKAYPGVTQWMVRGTIARLMQMLWPQTEKNYGIKPSPLPELSKDSLQQVLDKLIAQKAQQEQIDPAAVELAKEEVEKEILVFAKGKAERMEVKVADDLAEMEFITLARKVVKSAVTYNVGVARGPLHEKHSNNSWQKNPFNGRWEAVEGEILKPLFEFLPVWDHYFDMTATAIDKQSGTYDRHIMTRGEVEALASRTDFITGRINTYLREHTAGNYKAQWWESEIKGEKKSATAPVATKETRKYEALSYWGEVTGHDIRAAGIEVKEADLGKTFHANAWMIDNTVIKLKLAPFGKQIRHHHYFVFEDDDLSILGNGQCDVLRDSQMSICETARAALDNASVIGPMAVVDDDYLTPGQDVSIRKHKTWRFEGLTGNRSVSSVLADVQIDSHLTELKMLLDMFMSFAQQESGLPPPSMGDVSGGGSEALRTSKNASMFLGAAALPIRDTVRNYDSFTISLISALVAWNQKYASDASRDGDHDVIARGSTSLIAREVLTNSLNEFKASLTPDEIPHVKSRELLIARMKVNDLPIEDLLEDETVASQRVKAQEDAAVATHQSQLDMVQAQIKELLMRALEHQAKASSEGVNAGTAVLQSLIDAMTAGHASINARDKNVADQVKAAAAMVAAHKPNAPKASGGSK